MEKKRYCVCGCGGEVKVWKNGVASPFLRGHHMRKQGYTPKPSGPHYCRCGCGSETNVKKNGHINEYIKGHHLKGIRYTLEQRIARMRKSGKEPVVSPYMKDIFIYLDKKQGRWCACERRADGKSKNSLHANAVYRHHFGEIPAGCVVHHKNGKHSSIKDDRPDNLMVLPDEWNLRFFPVLAKGFGFSENIVTDCYLEIFDSDLTSEELFSKLSGRLIEKKENEAIDKAKRARKS